MSNWLTVLNSEVVACVRCPRLIVYREQIAPTNSVRSGGFRKAQIKPKDGYKVQARSGYFAMPEKD